MASEKGSDLKKAFIFAENSNLISCIRLTD